MLRRRLFVCVATAGFVFVVLQANAALSVRNAALSVQRLDHRTIAHALSDRPEDPFLNFLIGLAHESYATASEKRQ